MTPPRTGHHLIVSGEQTTVAGARGGIRHWGTGKRKLLPFLLARGAEAVELQPISHLACRLLFHQDLLLSYSSPPFGCLAKSSSVPWPYQPGRSAGPALGMDSSEVSCPISRSGIVSAKPAAMVDGKGEPAGKGLPDGWLKECRPQKNRHESRAKDDMFYIDPIHGYEFRSLKDVYRYLQSGDISQCVKLPNKRKIEDLHNAGNPSHHTEIPSDCTHLDTANQSNGYNIGGTESLRDSRLSPERGSSKPDNINSVQRKSDHREDLEVRSIQSGSKEHTPEEAESVTRKGVNMEHRTKGKKRKAKPVKQMATPLRSSPRLAALRISQEENNASRDGLRSTETDITNQLQPKQVKSPRINANSSVLPVPEKNDGTSNSSENTEDNYCLVPNQIRASVPCSSAGVGYHNILTGMPVLPQQVELGETTAGMPGPALSSLFRHVWSDPCLQFAFRTLIGDIPVLNDSLATANYFLPQPNFNKGITPNCSSSAYDGPRSHAQVDHVSLSMPRPSDKLYGSSWFPLR